MQLLAQNEQIKTAFEQLDMTTLQIAEQFQLDEVAVKACLMSCSTVYRKTLKGDDSNIEHEFSSMEAKEAANCIVNLMRYSEDEHLRFKTAKYIRDDRKGRLDIGKNLKALPMNVSLFQQILVQAQGAVQASKTLATHSQTVSEANPRVLAVEDVNDDHKDKNKELIDV